MDVAQLLEPVVAGGIKDTHFFNGRILTADDLRTMQAAARQHDAQLARAIGDGVAYGLQVSIAPASAGGSQVVLHVERGLALNPLGERAALSSAVDVALVQSPDVQVPNGVFAVCEPPTDGEFTNLGLYLFTIAPVSGLDGHAPMTTLSSAGAGSTCGSRYEVEGVKFDMHPLTLPSDATPDRTLARELFALVEQQLDSAPSGGISPTLSRLRNLVAYLCLGDDVVINYSRDLLVQPDPALVGGWLDELQSQRRISTCEVPLALVYWSKWGVEFVDMWAVRRRVQPRRRTFATWERLVEGTARAEARLEQFQSQVEDLRKRLANPPGAVAQTYFRYLPPAGILPLAGPAHAGFDLLAFFSGMTTRKPAVIEGARVEQLLRESLLYPPIDMASAEHIWMYLVRDNKEPIDLGPPPAPPYYVIFARGDVPYRGNAHFDVAHWDYSSYALGCGGLDTIQLA
jgi:hypothetical protein